MEDLRERLENTLKDFFAHQNVGSGEYRVFVGFTLLGRVYGIVAWSRFDNMEVTKRQEVVWKHIRQKLEPNEVRKISAIYTKGMVE